MESNNGFKFLNSDVDELFGTEEDNITPFTPDGSILKEYSVIKCKETLPSHPSLTYDMSSDGDICDHVSLSNIFVEGEK